MLNKKHQTNAHIRQYLNKSSNVWNWKTREGATIHTALNYAMTISPNLTNESSHIAELFPDVAAVAAVYGDESGRYADFLRLGAPQYTKQPYYFWYQPRPTNTTSTTPSPTSVSSSSRNSPLLAFFRMFLLLNVIQGLLPLGLISL